VVLFKAISQHLPQRVEKYEKSLRFCCFRFENNKLSQHLPQRVEKYEKCLGFYCFRFQNNKISQHLPQRVEKYEKSLRFYYFRFQNNKISIIRHIVVVQMAMPGLNIREYFEETADGKTRRYISCVSNSDTISESQICATHKPNI
jgi:hypothetical protein